MPFHRLSRLGPAEVAGEAERVGVEGVEGEVVVVQPLVVPGRAGAVVAAVGALHLVVALEPGGVVVLAADPVGLPSGLLAVRGDAVGVLPRRELAGPGVDVDEHPVVEVRPRQVLRDGPSFLIDVIGLRGDVGVVAEEHERPRALRQVGPLHVWALVGAHLHVTLGGRVAEAVLVRDAVAILEGSYAELHGSVVAWVREIGDVGPAK